MKKAFMGSLICRNGILGGAIYIEDNSITYKTNKLTVDKKYKNILLPIGEIQSISWSRIVFPIATFNMANGEQYKFMIFNKKRFNKYFCEIDHGD